jgi:hypothetical protein
MSIANVYGRWARRQHILRLDHRLDPDFEVRVAVCKINGALDHQAPLQRLGLAAEQVFGKPVLQAAGPLGGFAADAVGCGGRIGRLSGP